MASPYLLAGELARFGIQVLVIAPDLIETPMMASLSEEARERLECSLPGSS